MTHARRHPVDARRNVAKGASPLDFAAEQQEWRGLGEEKAQPSRMDVALKRRRSASSVVDIGAPGEAPSDRHRCRDFRSRCHGGSRKQVDGTVLSVDGNALAPGMLVREDVVPEVKRLQRQACGEQNQDGDMGEAWMHDPH